MFAPEHDHAGNPICGMSFMGGTICTMPPNHSGGCGALCQTCGGDWVNETCTCLTKCPDCGVAHEGIESNYCADCRCHGERARPASGKWEWDRCVLELGHEHEGVSHAFFDPGPTEEELAETYRILGAEPPN